MSVPSGPEHLRIDAAAIVADYDPELTVGIFELDFDAAGARMAEGIGQSFTADAVDFIANHGMERARLAFDDQTKIDGVLENEFLWNTGEGLFEIVGFVADRAQAAHRVPTIGNDLAHKIEDTVDERFRRPVLRHLIVGDMELHGSTQNSLQQGIVQLLRDSGAFRQPFFETDIQAELQLMQPEAVQEEHDQSDGDDTSRAEPPGLPECGLDSEGSCIPGTIPYSVAVACDHAKVVEAGAEIGVNRLAGCDRLAPAAIEAFHEIPEANAVRHRQAETGVMKCDSLLRGRNADRVAYIDLPGIG